MKLRKYKLVFIHILLIVSVLFSKENKTDFLYGSIVKSDTWEIDRINNIEKFNGNVCFRNSYYKMKSDNAIYYHKNKLWDISGNVYFLRMFDNNLKIEVFCDLAQYLENYEKTNLSSNQNNHVKIIYHDKDNKKLVSISKKVLADNKQQIMEFIDEFSIYTDSAIIKADKAIYNHKDNEFFITGKNPILNAYREDYETYIGSYYIKLNKDSMSVSFYDNVRGVIIAEDLKNRFKINETIGQRDY